MPNHSGGNRVKIGEITQNLKLRGKALQEALVKALDEDATEAEVTKKFSASRGK